MAGCHQCLPKVAVKSPGILASCVSLKEWARIRDSLYVHRQPTKTGTTPFLCCLLLRFLECMTCMPHLGTNIGWLATIWLILRASYFLLGLETHGKLCCLCNLAGLANAVCVLVGVLLPATTCACGIIRPPILANADNLINAVQILLFAAKTNTTKCCT